MSTRSYLDPSDFHAWSQRAAALVREHKLHDLGEELDSIGANGRRELINRQDVLLAHLLNWKHQPDHRTGSWDGTIREQRRQIAREIKLSPSLKPFLPEALDDVYPDGTRMRWSGPAMKPDYLITSFRVSVPTHSTKFWTRPFTRAKIEQRTVAGLRRINTTNPAPA